MAVKVDPTTVATDSFMLNMQAILLRFAEPFMDANYTKVFKILTALIYLTFVIDGSYRLVVLYPFHPHKYKGGNSNQGHNRRSAAMGR